MDRTLTREDVPKIVEMLLDIQHKARILGLVLKLPRETVVSIQNNSDQMDHLFDVIDEFVKLKEPRPTWRVIVKALRSPIIGVQRLADMIERKYEEEEGNAHFPSKLIASIN